MEYRFDRNIDEGIINKLKAEDLWKKKLKQDCIDENVFLAIRSDNVSFYHKSRSLFKFDNSDGFKTHKKFASVINWETGNDDVNQKDLKEATVISNFLDGYDYIKNNAQLYAEKEGLGVSTLYHGCSYLSDSNIVVLDVEIAFSKEKDPNRTKRTLDKIDILLYNKKERRLRFIEAKLFDNPDIRAKLELDKNPKVISQIQRYEKQVKKQHGNIIASYQKYIKTLNGLFGISIPAPEKLDPNVGLLIFDFGIDEKEGQLKKHITRNSKYKNIKIAPIGSLSGKNMQFLWQKTSP